MYPGKTAVTLKDIYDSNKKYILLNYTSIGLQYTVFELFSFDFYFKLLNTIILILLVNSLSIIKLNFSNFFTTKSFINKLSIILF